MPLPQVLQSRRQVDKFFVPSHSSRHRIAVTALYKALLTLAKKVPLPIEITHGFNKTWSGELKPPDRHGNLLHPVADLVRRTFKRNKPDVSPRTITPALAAGYRALELLQDAQTPDSAGNKEILVVLRQRLVERNRSLGAKAKSNLARGIRPGDKPPPKVTYPPLLVNATPEPTPENPRPAPVFLPSERPRPKSSLTGTRVVPHMDLAQGFPFIRIRKPTPHVLSATLQVMINKRTKRVQQALEFKDIDSQDAQLEDKWETAIAELAREEHLPNYSPADYRKRAERETAFLKKRNAKLEYQDPFASPETAGARKSHVEMDYTEHTLSDIVHHHRADKEVSPDSGQFATTVWNHGLVYTEDRLTYQQELHVARAQALRDLVGQERALKQEEKYVSHLQRKEKWIERMEEEWGPDKWQDVVRQSDMKKGKEKEAIRVVARERFLEKKADKRDFLDDYYARLPEKMRKFEEDEAERTQERQKRLRDLGRPSKTSTEVKKEERLMVGEEKKKVRIYTEMDEKDKREIGEELQKVERKAMIEMERKRFEARMVPLGENVPSNMPGPMVLVDPQRQKEKIQRLWEERKAELLKDIAKKDRDDRNWGKVGGYDTKPESKDQMKSRVYLAKTRWARRLARGSKPNYDGQGTGWTRKKIEERITRLLQYEAKRVEKKRELIKTLRKRQRADAELAARLTQLRQGSESIKDEWEVVIREQSSPDQTNDTPGSLRRRQKARLRKTIRLKQEEVANKHHLLRIRKDIQKRQAMLESRGGSPDFTTERVVAMQREKQRKATLAKREVDREKLKIDERRTAKAEKARIEREDWRKVKIEKAKLGKEKSNKEKKQKKAIRQEAIQAKKMLREKLHKAKEEWVAATAPLREKEQQQSLARATLFKQKESELAHLPSELRVLELDALKEEMKLRAKKERRETRAAMVSLHGEYPSADNIINATTQGTHESLSGAPAEA